MIESDRELLLAGVLANPEDIAPRLAFADYLLENGEEEWGEFIKQQCRGERAKMRIPLLREISTNFYRGEAVSVSWGKGRCTMTNAATTGRASVQRDFIANKKNIFENGFLHEIRWTLPDFILLGPSCIAKCPVQKVVFTDRRPLADGETYSFGLRQVVVANGEVSDYIPIWFVPGAEYERVFFPTEEEAIDWLSSLALQWARLPQEERFARHRTIRGSAVISLSRSP